MPNIMGSSSESASSDIREEVRTDTRPKINLSSGGSSESEIDEFSFRPRLPLQCLPLVPGWPHSSVSKYHAHNFWDAHKSNDSTLYLFHGHALDPDSDVNAVIESFQQYGPSLRFSWNTSFFFRRKAIYWTNSFEYAVLWCFYRKHGFWPSSWGQFEELEHFRCIVFVSKLARDEFDALGNIEVMPPRKSEKEELEFEKWCKATCWDRWKMEYDKENTIDYHLRTDLDVLVAKCILSERLTWFGLLPDGYSPDDVWCFGLAGKDGSEKLASCGCEIIFFDRFSKMA